MLFVNDPNKAWLKRTLRGNYMFTQSTPVSGFLDPNWNRSVPIWPGMAFMRTLGQAYAEDALSYTSGDIVAPPGSSATGFLSGAEQAFTLINNVGAPFGLVGQYIGGDGMDELTLSGINALNVWTLGPDAQFVVDAPAFDASLNWTGADPGTGGEVLIYARTANNSAVAGLNGMAGPTGTVGLQGQLIIPNATDGFVPNAGTLSGQPVARLLGIVSATTIVIGGLAVRYPVPGTAAGQSVLPSVTLPASE
jgi:hypothetical protein